MIVGMVGRAGSGKDTVADLLVKNHGFVKVAFADLMKRWVKEAFDFTDEQLWGPSSKRNEGDARYRRRRLDLDGDWVDSDLSPREALQLLGTEWGRRCYEDVWVNYTLRIADRLLAGNTRDVGYVNWYSAQSGLLFVGSYPTPKGVVISDVRFPNEVSALQAKGAVLWKTVYIAPGAPALTGQAAAHESERYIDMLDTDFVVASSTIDALPAAVEATYEFSRALVERRGR